MTRVFKPWTVQLFALGILALFLAGATGCVSMDEHKRLQAAFDQARAQLANAENDVNTLRAKNADLEAKIAELNRLLNGTGDLSALKRERDLLAAQLADLQDKYKKLLELGPGTGAFTRQIQLALPPEARYLGLDMNPAFIARLRGRFPRLCFEQAPAQDFDYSPYLAEGGFDAIVCGLPWTAFPESLQTAILDKAFAVLKPGGLFATFAYTGFHRLPQGQKFRELLARRSSRLETTGTVWRNLPPAFVYVASK